MAAIASGEVGAEMLDAARLGCYSFAHEQNPHHYLLHYFLLTTVAGCSFTFQ